MNQTTHRQNSFTGGILTASMGARTDIKKYSAGAMNIDNCIIEVHGALSKRKGFKFIEELPKAKNHRLIEFIYAVNDSYLICLSADASYCDIKIYRDDIVVFEQQNFLPYNSDELYELKYTQSCDVIFLGHHNHPPAELSRLAHDNWIYKTIDFEPQLQPPTSITAIADGHSGGKEIKVKYAVSSVDAAGVESLPIKSSSCSIRDPWVGGATVKITWEAVAEAERYNIYKDTRGYFGFIGNVDNETLAFTDDNITEKSDDSPKSLDIPFKAGQYPNAIGIYQQRMVFANTFKDRQSIFLTASGTYSDFTVSSPTKDDDSIEFKVDSRQGNEVKYIIPMKNLIVLTTGTEIMITGNQSNVLTPTAVNAKIQSYWGCHDVNPIICGKSVLFVGRHGKKVRDLMYALSDDGYSGGDLTVLASSLFDAPIKDWCYAQQPHSIVWVLLENGKLLSLTYLKEHEVFAWARHTVNGKIISLSSIPNLEHDDVYILIKYNDKLLLERLGRTNENIYLDHAVELNNTNLLTASPLSENVAVVDNDNYIGDFSTTQDLPNNVIGYCGINYKSIIATLDPELSNDGQDKLMSKRINRVALKLVNSANLKISTPDQEPIAVLAPEIGKITTLFSGIECVDVFDSTRDEATVEIYSDAPYPFTLLSIIKEIEIGQ